MVAALVLVIGLVCGALAAWSFLRASHEECARRLLKSGGEERFGADEANCHESFTVDSARVTLVTVPVASVSTKDEPPRLRCVHVIRVAGEVRSENAARSLAHAIDGMAPRLTALSSAPPAVALRALRKRGKAA